MKGVYVTRQFMDQLNGRIDELEAALVEVGQREVWAQLQVIEYEKLSEEDVVLLVRENARAILERR